MKRTFALIAAVLLLATLASCSINHKGDGFYDGFYYAGASAPMAMDEENLLLNESYQKLSENPFFETEKVNNSYFSLDSNTAAYANLRRYIENKQSLNGNIIKTDELINYFSYSYPQPQDGEVFRATATGAPAPWNDRNLLLTLALTTKEEDPLGNQGRNFVFLIDVSGSMMGAGRLPLVKTAMCLLTDELADSDVISIVTYASGVRTLADGLRGNQKEKIKKIINGLSAGGSTYGSGGINQAYALAEKHFIKDGNNRVIIATDGDFNVGTTSQGDLTELIAGKRESGVYLTCLGFGMYNYKDVTMETLAKNGNGGYAYIDSETEAKKVLVEDLNKTLTVVSKDAKAMVSFDPAVVAAYRLIGYENKQLTEEDFHNEEKDAGEIGSGHTSVVCYELSLREDAPRDLTALTLKIHDKDPKKDTAREYEAAFTLADLQDHAPTADDRFVAALVEFSLILRDSEYRGQASYGDLLSRLGQLDLAADPYKSEFYELVKQAKAANLLADARYDDPVSVTVAADGFYVTFRHAKGEKLTLSEIVTAVGADRQTASFWYDEAFTEAYSETSVSADLTLYLKTEPTPAD